jgi:hypothetical protein
MDELNIKKQLKREMDAAYKAFTKNPSAINYVKLERAMLKYQMYDKNRDHYAAGG